MATFLFKLFLTYSREHFYEIDFSLLYFYSYEVQILKWLQYYGNHIMLFYAHSMGRSL